MILHLLYQLIDLLCQMQKQSIEKIFSKECLIKIEERIASLTNSMEGLVYTVTKSDNYLCNSDDMITDIITGFMSNYASIEHNILYIRTLADNVLNCRRKYRMWDDDKNLKLRNTNLDISTIFKEVLRVYQDINTVVGVEITPLYKIKRAQEITKKLDVILHDFADYLSRVEQAIPQTKKEIQLFLKTVDKYLAKIQRHAMYQDRFTRFMIGRYNLYTDNMLDTSFVEC